MMTTICTTSEWTLFNGSDFRYRLIERYFAFRPLMTDSSGFPVLNWNKVGHWIMIAIARTQFVLSIRIQDRQWMNHTHSRDVNFIRGKVKMTVFVDVGVSDPLEWIPSFSKSMTALLFFWLFDVPRTIMAGSYRRLATIFKWHHSFLRECACGTKNALGRRTCASITVGHRNVKTENTHRPQTESSDKCTKRPTERCLHFHAISVLTASAGAFTLCRRSNPLVRIEWNIFLLYFRDRGF